MENHIKTDGNGKILISKTFAVISLIIALLGMILPTVFAYGGLNERVDGLEETITLGIPQQAKVISEMKTSISTNTLDNAVIEAKYDQIIKELEYIKADLKELRKG